MPLPDQTNDASKTGTSGDQSTGTGGTDATNLDWVSSIKSGDDVDIEKVKALAKDRHSKNTQLIKLGAELEQIKTANVQQQTEYQKMQARLAEYENAVKEKERIGMSDLEKLQAELKDERDSKAALMLQLDELDKTARRSELEAAIKQANPIDVQYVTDMVIREQERSPNTPQENLLKIIQLERPALFQAQQTGDYTGQQQQFVPPSAASGSGGRTSSDTDQRMSYERRYRENQIKINKMRSGELPYNAMEDQKLKLEQMNLNSSIQAMLRNPKKKE